MPNVPSFGAFLPGKLNACNSSSPTGAVDAYGVQYPTGLVNKRVIELSFAEAQALQVAPPSVEQLYEGIYQWVQVDSGATQANVNAGLAAYYKINAASNSNNAIATVTDEANATSTNLFAGVFLNPITVGNYGFIFSGGGRVNVTYKASLGTSGAIGNTVLCAGGTGFFDSGSASTTTPKVVGIQTVAAAGGGTSQIFMAGDYVDVG